MSIVDAANSYSMLTVFEASSSIPACHTTACAPCYITASPSTMEFPESFDIQDQTYTIDVVPHVTEMADGVMSTVYETLSMNDPTVTDLQLQSEFTWVENNLTLYVCQIALTSPQQY